MYAFVNAKYDELFFNHSDLLAHAGCLDKAGKWRGVPAKYAKHFEYDAKRNKVYLSPYDAMALAQRLGLAIAATLQCESCRKYSGAVMSIQNLATRIECPYCGGPAARKEFRFIKDGRDLIDEVFKSLGLIDMLK